jgi:hypothetical protein
MGLNWKRGLTRLYIVLWGLWLIFVAIRTVVATPSIFVGSIPGFVVVGFVITGLIFPALLLLALRWAGKGFSR